MYAPAVDGVAPAVAALHTPLDRRTRAIAEPLSVENRRGVLLVRGDAKLKLMTEPSVSQSSQFIEMWRKLFETDLANEVFVY